jgi:hypothetical protein
MRGAMNKDFNYRDILIRHQLRFLARGGVPLHPEVRSGLRQKLETIHYWGNTATDLRIY